MKKFVSKALTSVFLDKNARRTMEMKRRRHSLAAAAPEPPPEMTRRDLNARLDAKLEDFRRQAANPATLERQALIQNALKIHGAKSKIFENLSDEERRKLHAMAITAFSGGSEKYEK
jgi:hypothetical protein